MAEYLYAFAAKGIQNYIFASNKLKEIIGASELIEQLCDTYVKEALEAMGAAERCEILVCTAGWGRLLFSAKADAEEFAKFWPLLVEQYAPGLSLVQALIPVDQGLSVALTDVAKKLEEQRSQPVANLPEIGPLVDRAPRTGKAAVTRSVSNFEQGRPVLIDAATQRKLQIRMDASERLLKNMFGEEIAGSDAWTDDLKLLAGSERNYLAVVHADGNGLGQLVAEVSRRVKDNKAGQEKERFAAFSEIIGKANRRAVKTAFHQVIAADYYARQSEDEKRKLYYRARPIIFGGDDLTIILAAELALSFTQVYLGAFEQEAGKLLRGFETTLSSKLTACAGIAYAKASYPFVSSCELSEALCEAAKKASRKEDGSQVSSLMFHRISSSVCNEFEELAERELTARDGLKLWMGPYLVGGDSEPLRKLDQLRTLAEAISELPRGSIRQLISELYLDRGRSKDAYRRICQLLNNQPGQRGTAKLQKLKQAVVGLTGDENSLWTKGEEPASPLLDAHVVREMGLFPVAGGSDD